MAYNTVILAANHDLVTELWAKLDELRGAFNQDKVVTLQIWCEVYNILVLWKLYNACGWDMEEGFLEKGQPADFVWLSDVCPIHMDGFTSLGIDTKACWIWRDNVGTSSTS